MTMMTMMLIVIGPPGDKGERGAPGEHVSMHLYCLHHITEHLY